MIIVHLPRQHLAERSYAVKLLLEVILGLDYRVIAEERRDTIFQLPNENTFTIVDSCWQQRDYLKREKLGFRGWLEVKGLAPLPVLFGAADWQESADQVVTHADLLAGAFLIATRWEETVQPEVSDAHGRFPASASLALQHDFLHQPVVEEYATCLYIALQRLGLTQTRKQHTYRLVPTHDIDALLFYDSLPKQLAVQVSRLLGSNDYAPYLRGDSSTADPHDSFSYLMGLAEGAGVQAHFYFKTTRKRTHHDLPYRLSSAFGRKLLQEINKRGHTIGFHPGYATVENMAQWQDELAALSAISPQAVLGGRQHFLRFRAPHTWRLWEDAGMAFDSTVGYSEVPGFRTGMCRPYPVFDVLARKELLLLERPLIAMETSFFNNLEENIHSSYLSPEAMALQLLVLRDTVKHCNGEFVFLWHNSTVFTQRWSPYRPVLEALY